MWRLVSLSLSRKTYSIPGFRQRAFGHRSDLPSNLFTHDMTFLDAFGSFSTQQHCQYCWHVKYHENYFFLPAFSTVIYFHSKKNTVECCKCVRGLCRIVSAFVDCSDNRIWQIFKAPFMENWLEPFCASWCWHGKLPAHLQIKVHVGKELICLPHCLTVCWSACLFCLSCLWVYPY